MPKVIARVYGTAMVPGISRNGRLYTRELIERAVARAQPRLDAGNLLLTEETDTVPGADLHPLTQRTHHAAEDDSTRIVGRLTELSVTESGAAKFASDIVDTEEGRKIVDLIDNSDGPAFLRGVSIRGAWLGEVRKQLVDGVLVEVADDLDLDGLDYTARPGVTGAVVDKVERVGAATTTEETALARTPIYESVQEALVSTPVTEEAPAQAAPTRWADPSYHAEPRLPLDSVAQARAAWHQLRTPAVAETYTAAQLKRVRERTQRALKDSGVEPLPNGWLMERAAPTPAEVAECFDCLPVAVGCPPEPDGSFSVRLDNGVVSIYISSWSMDPHDLTRVGRAAMEGAAAALELLDPDMDGDADAGAGPSETAAAAPSVAESAQQPDEAHEGPDGELAAQAATEPSPDSATVEPGTTQEEEEPGVSEPTSTTPATTPAAAPAVPAGFTLSDEQFAQWLAAQAPAAAAAPAPELVGAGAPVESATPAAPVAESESTLVARLVAEQLAKAGITVPVEETAEQRIARLVETQVRETVQSAAEAGVLGGRKGHVVTSPAGGVTESADGTVLPEGVEDKPFHELGDAEWRKVRNQAAAEIAGIQL
ncbi:hypothetical protein [Pseudonocardia sp. T1-2H]|uniref:hypothetical protein n=1 Tax=Pseudonocardia sp. T1-2H TaxID=3128899 RepID=UPI0031012F48